MQLINFPSLGYLCPGPLSRPAPLRGSRLVAVTKGAGCAGLRASPPGSAPLRRSLCVDSLVSRFFFFFPLFRALYDITRTEAVHFFKQCLPDSICNGIGGRKCNCVLNMRQPYMKISRAE